LVARCFNQCVYWQDPDPRGLHVATGRKRSSLESFYEGRSEKELNETESNAVDMHRPLVTVTAIRVPKAESKIAFNKFHVIKLFTSAVERVRREENRVLMAEGDRTLVRSEYAWLMNPQNMNPTMKSHFRKIQKMSLEVGQSGLLKEAAQNLWRYTTQRWAAIAWINLCEWAHRTPLRPMIEVGSEDP